MNSKFSTFSTIVGIGCWGEVSFFGRWLRVSGRISFFSMAGIGYEGSFLLNFVSLLDLVFHFALLSFEYGVAEVLGGRSSRIVSPRCRKRIEIASCAVSPRLPETLPLGAGIDISNRC